MPDEIQDLFDRDPPYTDEEVDQIIEKMRQLRASFRAGDQRAGTAPRRKQTKREEKAAGIDIGDIEV